jgi:hypothetical protein
MYTTKKKKMKKKEMKSGSTRVGRAGFGGVQVWLQCCGSIFFKKAMHTQCVCKHNTKSSSFAL